MLCGWRQWQLLPTLAVVFRRDDALPMSKTSPEITRQPYWLIEIPQISRILSDFTFKRSRLMPHGWWRLPEIAQMARYRCKNITDDEQVTIRIDQNSTITKIYAYKIKQDLSKNIFLLLGRCHYDANVHCFFLLSLATAFVLAYKKCLDDLDPTEKLRHTY